MTILMNTTDDYTPGDWVEDEINDGVMFEDILEDFDLTPREVFNILYDEGFIDPELLQSYLTV